MSCNTNLMAQEILCVIVYPENKTKVFYVAPCATVVVLMYLEVFLNIHSKLCCRLAE